MTWLENDTDWLLSEAVSAQQYKYEKERKKERKRRNKSEKCSGFSGGSCHGTDKLCVFCARRVDA